MSQTSTKRPARRGRLFPEYTISPEELAKIKAENEAFHQRCRVIFARVQAELIKDRYNWFIVIEPDSGDYCIDINLEIASRKLHQKYPNAIVGVFRLNETGACCRI